MPDQVNLAVDLGRGLRLRSPVLVASGTFGYGFDAPQVDRGALGAIVTKGTTLRAREGNPPARIAETASGMLNAIGLQNPGVDEVAGVYAPVWRSWDLPVIVNVAGDSVEEYVAVVGRLEGVAGIAGIELNISCPNVALGMQFGVNARLAGELTRAVRSATTLPLMVKLTPNVTDIVAIASAVEEGGADCISAINTYVGMAFDVRRRRPVLDRGSGGGRGPAIKPPAPPAEGDPLSPAANAGEPSANHRPAAVAAAPAASPLTNNERRVVKPCDCSVSTISSFSIRERQERRTRNSIKRPLPGLATRGRAG